MIRELLNSLDDDQRAEIMEAFNTEISHVLFLEDNYLAVHFTPDPSKYDEKERSTYWSCGLIKQ